MRSIIKRTHTLCRAEQASSSSSKPCFYRKSTTNYNKFFHINDSDSVSFFYIILEMNVGNCAVLIHFICSRRCQCARPRQLKIWANRVTTNKTSNRICLYTANYSQHNQVSVTSRVRLAGMSPTEFVLNVLLSGCARTCF